MFSRCWNCEPSPKSRFGETPRDNSGCRLSDCYHWRGKGWDPWFRRSLSQKFARNFCQDSAVQRICIWSLISQFCVSDPSISCWSLGGLAGGAYQDVEESIFHPIVSDILILVGNSWWYFSVFKLIQTKILGSLVFFCSLVESLVVAAQITFSWVGSSYLLSVCSQPSRCKNCRANTHQGTVLKLGA